MKKLILLSSLCFFLTTMTQASSAYQHYVSLSQLHSVYKRVKHGSNVSQKALAKTFEYYEHNRYSKHLSPNYLAVADYTKMALQKRLFIVNLHTGRVSSYLLAHGKNSGAKGGRVWRASNVRGSNKTPIGFFKIGYKEKKTSKYKHDYLAVDGLEWKNRNARVREILLHTASYVARGGRSNGCFAIMPQDKWAVFPRLKNALIYSYVGQN